MDLANAGVAIRMVNPNINPANLNFFSLNTLHSPFLKAFNSINAFHVQT
jgi:hypothetical protein